MSADRLALLVSAGEWRCAVPSRYLIEVMRALPVRPVVGAEPFIVGVSVIRGAPIPVIDLGMLVRDEPGGRAARYVHLRVAQRRVALAVDAVQGLVDVRAVAADLPPLVRSVRTEWVEAIGTRDRDVLLLLDAVRIVSASAT